MVKVEGEIDPITKVMMDIESPISGVELDIRYDNLKVRSSGDLYKFKQEMFAESFFSTHITIQPENLPTFIKNHQK
ncbi:MAG: hypothetical protein KAJ66_05650 [Candidatus Omnitrophica bacterium]|nr:hypothetical protein [Candidatus Omnitrophota bacterium]